VTMAQAHIPLFKVYTADTAHAALKPVLESGRLATGPQVANFESRLAAWLGAPRVVGLSDASGGLTMAMYLAGVRPGDEVIVSPLTCAATVMPIANLFARPVWCEVDPLTGMIDPAAIAGLISEKTRALILYHWSGNVADIGKIAAITKRHAITLIQDASEAFGAEYRNRRMGSEADFTIYSFYATKHINCGEGAALLATDPAALESALCLRRLGIDYRSFRLANGDLNPDFDVPYAGFNLAMNEIAATLGLEGLRHADEIVARHQENGRYYESALREVPGVRLLRQVEGTVSGYWVYSLLADRRDDLVRKLAAQGIGVQRLHLRIDGYACFGGVRRNLPGVAEFDACNLCIPCGWWVGAAERERIVECIRTGW
jgi:perosamine synthetase